MNWQRELDELRRRERMAQAMGGPDKVKRQHDGGRLTVRDASPSSSTPAASMRSAPLPAAPATTRRTNWSS